MNKKRVSRRKSRTMSSMSSGVLDQLRNKEDESLFKKWISIVASIIAILGFLFELLTGGTLLNLIKFRSHSIGTITVTQSFSVIKLTDNFKRNLESGDRFSYAFGVPLVAQGFISTELETDETIWVVLIDSYGKYFPQYPPLQLINDNQWKATNIRPLNGITDIIFIKVDKVGYAQLLKTIDDNIFQMKKLPQSAKELGRIELK